MYRYIVLAVVALVPVLLALREGGPVEGVAEGVIRAPLQAVWDTQLDLARWPSWNAEVESMQVVGEVGLGTEFTWKAGGLTIHSKIIELQPHRRVVWQGEALGLSAVHAWDFADTADGVRVRTHERFTGPLAWLLPGTMRKQLDRALVHGIDVLQTASERRDVPGRERG